MCPVAQGGVTSCQITYFPIKTVTYTEEINEVLQLIKSYPLQVEIGVLSTTVRGDKETVFKMLNEIYDNMSSKGYNFTISVMLSNICGCKA